MIQRIAKSSGNMKRTASALAACTFTILAPMAAGATLTYDFESSTGPVTAAGADAQGSYVSSEARQEHLAGGQVLVLTSGGSPDPGLLVATEMEYNFAETFDAASGNMAFPSDFENFGSLGLNLESGDNFSLDSIFIGELTATDADLVFTSSKGSVSRTAAGYVDTSSGDVFDFSEEPAMQDISSVTITATNNGNSFNVAVDDVTITAVPEPGTAGLLLLAAAPLAFRRARRV